MQRRDDDLGIGHRVVDHVAGRSRVVRLLLLHMHHHDAVDACRPERFVEFVDLGHRRIRRHLDDRGGVVAAACMALPHCLDRVERDHLRDLAPGHLEAPGRPRPKHEHVVRIADPLDVERRYGRTGSAVLLDSRHRRRGGGLVTRRGGLGRPRCLTGHDGEAGGEEGEAGHAKSGDGAVSESHGFEPPLEEGCGLAQGGGEERAATPVELDGEEQSAVSARGRTRAEHARVAVEFDGAPQAPELEPREGIPGSGREQQHADSEELRVLRPPVLVLVTEDQAPVPRLHADGPRRKDDLRIHPSDHRGPEPVGHAEQVAVDAPARPPLALTGE